MWLGVALVAAFLLTAWPQLTRLYWVEQAGSLLDRNIVAGDAAALERAAHILGLGTGSEPDVPRAPTPQPGSLSDTATYWRTYGAVAARLPTEEAYMLMLAARDRGTLDRMGRLWLAEIAAATGHWDVAAEEYGRVEAVNLLVDRGDDALKEGAAETARLWYRSAARGLLAAEDPSPAGPGDDSTPSDIFEAGAGRTILLLRVAQGLLSTSEPEEALPVLERAESEVQAYPPGAAREQAVRFTLARVLAMTMPPDTTAGAGASERRRRILTLLARAVEAEETGWSRLQEAQVRLQIGDRSEAFGALRTALELDPALTDARLLMGLMLEQDGLHSLARDLYARGLDLSPGDGRLIAAWAKTTYLTQDAAAALPALRAAAKTDAADPAVFALLGDCLREVQDTPQARAAYREGLRHFPGNAPLTIRLRRLPGPTGAAE